MGEYNRRRRVRVDLNEFDLLPAKLTVEKLLNPSIREKENVLDRPNKKGDLRKKKQSSRSLVEQKNCVDLPDPKNDVLPTRKVLQKYRKPLGDLLDNREGKDLVNFSSKYGLPQRKSPVGLLTSNHDCLSENINLQPEKRGSVENSYPVETGSSKPVEPRKTPKMGYRKKRTLLSDDDSNESKKNLIKKNIASAPIARSFSFTCISKSPKKSVVKSGSIENSYPVEIDCSKPVEPRKIPKMGYRKKRTVPSDDDSIESKKSLIKKDIAPALIARSFSFTCKSKSPTKSVVKSGLPFKCSSPINPSKMSERRGTKGLELWCKKMTEGYPGVKIDNMTSSWRDGLAFCAIIHHFRPDLIDFSKLHKDDVYHNNELAFRVAEHHLGIPALLEPEDMVEYSVPDRLSILTYLSQFYQAFAAPQGSAARIAPKRPQTVPDHGIVSPASTSPPTKMALTSVGKIRREPCTKCALPVFIAERLNVGKLLFHRTCFRCARCNSQLTLANYYETESDEFCCEICPDEEKLMSKKATETLLLRSLSDEEKSASLKMITNDPDEFSTMFETALESVESDNVSSKEFTQARSQFIKTQMEGSGSGLDEDPPDLPRSLPPELSKSDKTDAKDSIVNSARFDSGFPKRPDTTVNNSTRFSVNKRDGSSAALDESRNVVTKDISAQEGDISLVKARMRLFENNNSKDSDISKSDVYRKSRSSEKVPKTPDKSPVKTIPIVRLEELEHFDNSSIKEDSDKDDKSINEPIVAIIKDDTKHSDFEQIVSNEGIVEQTPSTDQVQEEYVQHIIEDGTEHNEIKESEDIKNDLTEPIEGSVIVSDSADNSKDEVILIEDSPEKTDSQRKVSGTVSETREVSPIASEKTSPISLHEKLSDDPVVCIVVSDESVEPPIVTEKETTEVQETEMVSSVRVTPEVEESKLKLQLDTAEDSFSSSVTELADYPADLDPFGDEDQEEETNEEPSNRSLNPFGSEDEEDDPEPSLRPKEIVSPRVTDRVMIGKRDYQPSLHVDSVGINPFDDEPNDKPLKPLVSPRMKKKVMPSPSDREIGGTPDHLSGIHIERISVNPFETSPRPVARKKKVISPTKGSLNPFSSDEEDHETVAGEQPIPKPRVSRTPVQPPEPKPREAGYLALGTKINFGSNSSISSGSAYGSARKKKPAPRPPIPTKFDESANSSLTSSPYHSLTHSPNLTVRHKKQKKAPAPPIPKFASTPVPAPKEKNPSATLPSPIKMDLNEEASEFPEEYLRKNFKSDNCTQQEKSVKDETNRNRRSQEMPVQKSTSEEQLPGLPVPNKSTFGKWKRRKGQAPSKPIPQKRTIKCLPIAEIRRELEFIEIQQQGLEKQGVRLEQIIREKCEGTEMNAIEKPEDEIPIDVEDLILQLFELVNEKNELFRKQTELMYLRRQQRLEEEHADVEYQIRCLMLQPEANKTDSDKAREEELINRLIDIVERRNEIVECLEMDRVREAEEDDSISNHINLYTLNREADKSIPDNPKKEKDKDKKKHKKEKKSKNKSKDNVDMDKDVDESESYSTLEKKKKKKFALF